MGLIETVKLLQNLSESLKGSYPAEVHQAIATWISESRADRGGCDSLQHSLRDSRPMRTMASNLVAELVQILQSITPRRGSDGDLAAKRRSMLDILDSLQRLRTAAMAHNPSDYEQEEFLAEIEAQSPDDIYYVAVTYPSASPSIHRRLGRAISWRRAILDNDCSAWDGFSLSNAITAITSEMELLFGPGEMIAAMDDLGSDSSEALSDDSSPETKFNRLLIGDPSRRCPICKAEQRDIGDLPKHVLEHLQPYVCLFPDCAQSRRRYGTREAWTEHMRLGHHKTWRCCFGCNLSFQLTEDFDAHLLDHHATHFHTNELPTLRDLCEKHVLLPMDGGWCPLCRAEIAHPRRRQRHIAEHMESIAMHGLGIHVIRPMSSIKGGDEAESPGLLEIFNDCVDYLSSVELGPDYPRIYWHRVDALKIPILQLRLSRWKASVHLDGDNLTVAHDAKFASSDEVQTVQELLLHIRTTLKSAEERDERHQVRSRTLPTYPESAIRIMQTLTARLKQYNVFRARANPLAGRVLRDGLEMTIVIDNLDDGIYELVDMFPELETQQADLALIDATAILPLETDNNDSLETDFKLRFIHITQQIDPIFAAAVENLQSRRKDRALPTHSKTSNRPDAKGQMGEKPTGVNESKPDDDGKGKGKADTQYRPGKNDGEVDDDEMDNRCSTGKKGRADLPADPPLYESLWPSWGT